MYKCFSIIFLIFGLFFEGILHSLDVPIPTDFFLAFFISISFLLLFLDAYNTYKGKLKTYIPLAIILRMLIMLWNVYGRRIYCLPGIGTDTEGFYEAAVRVSENLTLLRSSIYGSYYSKYLGLIFYLTGPSYLLGSYLNFIYGVLSISVLKTIFDKMEFLSQSRKEIALLLYAFAPINIILSGSLRRESVILLFLIISLSHIHNWYLSSRFKEGVLGLAYALLASALHAGVIGVIIGYMIFLLFFNPKLGKWHFRRDSIFMASIIIVLALVVLTKYRGVFLSKIQIDDQEQLFRRMGRSVGNAAYLRNIKINSFADFVRYIPIKVFYFLLSPMPWNWRGLNDAIAFLLDSMLYLILLKRIISNISSIKKNPLLLSLCISFVASLLIFSVGCSNSANAMRHRLKLQGVLVVIYCIVDSVNNKEKQGNMNGARKDHD